MDNVFLFDNEMLLKVRSSDNMGFLTKLNKDGSIPVAFKQWKCYKAGGTIKQSIHKEIFRKGWLIDSWRSGKSQTWVIVKHPLGFKLEIRMDNFMNDVLPYVTKGMKITGEWKFTKNEIVKK